MSLGAAIVLAASCSACTSQPGDTAPDDAQGGPLSSPSIGASEQPLTLAAVFGFGATGEDYAQYVRQTEQARQELIRDCMSEQGFQYIPYVGEIGQIADPTGLPTDLSADQFRRQYGYGISTGFDRMLTLLPEPPSEGDPNVEIVAAMSQGEREAHDRSLGACHDEASSQVDRVAVVYAEFGDELAELSARVEADPRVIAAETSWSSCMAQAGYAFADESAAQLEIARRMNPLYDAVAGGDIPEGMTYGRRDVTLTPDQRALLDRVIEYELAVANADQDCRDDIGDVRGDVRAEFESQFIEDHRDELRELLPDSGL